MSRPANSKSLKHRKARYNLPEWARLFKCVHQVLESKLNWVQLLNQDIQWSDQTIPLKCFLFSSTPPLLPPPVCMCADGWISLCLSDKLSESGGGKWETHGFPFEGSWLTANFAFPGSMLTLARIHGALFTYRELAQVPPRAAHNSRAIALLHQQ